MRRGKRTGANILLLSALVSVGGACVDRDTAGEPDTSKTPVPEKFRPTVMTEPVATMSGAALWAFATDSTIWSDSVEADRLCAPEVSECNKQINAKKVRVRIWAHKAAKDVHDSTAGEHGTLVAKMENIGDAKERMYGLERENVYLLFLYKGNDTSGVYQLVEVKKDSTHAHRVAQRGTQIRCNHERQWQKSWATFSGCEDGIPDPPPYIVASRGFSLIKTAYAASAAMDAATSPAWITCPSGCCTSGSTAAAQ